MNWPRKICSRTGNRAVHLGWPLIKGESLL